MAPDLMIYYLAIGMPRGMDFILLGSLLVSLVGPMVTLAAYMFSKKTSRDSQSEKMRALEERLNALEAEKKAGGSD